jgi:hypothetical protein
MSLSRPSNNSMNQAERTMTQPNAQQSNFASLGWGLVLGASLGGYLGYSTSHDTRHTTHTTHTTHTRHAHDITYGQLTLLC